MVYAYIRSTNNLGTRECSDLAFNLFLVHIKYTSNMAACYGNNTSCIAAIAAPSFAYSALVHSNFSDNDRD